MSLQDFSAENDAELLVFMSVSDDDPSAAREAWAELYERHAEFLHGICWHAYSDLLHGDVSVGDLVAETFRRAFGKAGSFSCDDTEDTDLIRRRVRAWLGRIAQRLLQDILRGRSRLNVVHLEPEAWERVAGPSPATAPEDGRVELVREALEQLSPREQLVLRVTFQWYRLGCENQRLPSDVVEELSVTLGTTPENLRQIRRRALQRVRRLMNEVTAERRVPTGAGL